MPADPERVQAIFLLAVGVEDPAERAAVLDRECGADAELRERVEALLAADSAPDSLLDKPAALRAALLGALPGAVPTAPGEAITHLIPEATLGATIAKRYKLLEQIGEGGMGLVFMAEQKSPVRRLVALKVIKAGMDTLAVLARFEAERQALAMMDHPSIARVLDGGVTDRGHPWFAMELVRGLPLTEYCDQRRLSIPDRLELFIQICSAAQHAHQKGIIHRDLKPSNVLVTELDGRPLPKVIDFGLAKALGGGKVLTEHTLHTAYGAAAGTPLYMAPEQVAVSALDVDTRADVYALGVILYELLTGTTPVERERLKEAAWEEVRRVIREEEPPLPSLRISKSDALPSLAATRHIDPAKLSGLIKGDLDWIVLKALEKDRNRRYESASGLAADVRRHLADEPVIAAPPTLVYRGQKFIRKHRGPVAATAAISAALLLGLVSTTFMTLRYRAISAREAANAQSESEARATAELESYVANLSLAQMELTELNYANAREPLDRCPMSRRGWEWKFLDEQAKSVMAQIPGDCELSLDNSYVVSTSPEGMIQFWNTVGHPLSDAIYAGTPPIEVTFRHDSKQVLTASPSGIVQLWNSSGHPVGDQMTGYDEAHFVAKDTTIVTTNSGGRVRLWDIAGRAGSLSMETGSGSPTVQVSPDRKRVLTVSAKYVVRLWDGEGNAMSKPIMAKKPTVYVDMPDNWTREYPITAFFGEDGTRFCILSGNTCQIFDFDGAPLGEPFSLISGAIKLQLSPNGQWFVTVTERGLARISNFAGITLREIDLGSEGWQENGYDVEFNDDSAIVMLYSDTASIACDSHGKVVVEDRAFDLDVDYQAYYSVVSVPGRQELIKQSAKDIRFYGFDGAPKGKPIEAKHYVFFEDGRLITSDSKGTMRFWDQERRPLTKPISAGHGEVKLDISPDQTRVCSTSAGTVRFWDDKGRPQSPPTRIGAKTGDFYCYFSPQGKWLIASGNGRRLAFDCDGRLIVPWLDDGSSGPQYSPDESLVLANRDGILRLYDADGVPLGITRLAGHLSYDAEFAADGNTILLQEEDDRSRTLILSASNFGSPIELAGGGTAESVDREPVSPAPAGLPNERRITTKASSHDGLRIAFVTSDSYRTVRLCEPHSSRELARFHTNTTVKSLEFTADDTRLIVRLADGTTEIWDSRPRAERQADIETRWAEQRAARSWVQGYVDDLLKDKKAASDPAKLIANDPSLTSTQRSVAMHVLQDRLDDATAAE